MKAAGWGGECVDGGRVRDPDRPDDPPRRCPLIEHAPQTLEGAAVLRLIRSGGVLKTTGFAVTGLDMTELMARLPGRYDRALCVGLAEAAEAGLLAGYAEIQARQAGSGGSGPRRSGHEGGSHVA